MKTSDKVIMKAFIMEAEHLKHSGVVDTLLLQKSANHLLHELGLKACTVVLADNMGTSRFDATVIGQYADSTSFLGRKGTIKVQYNMEKGQMIKTFLHEVYHRVQFQVPRLTKKALAQGSFETDCYSFINKLSKKVGGFNV